MIGFDEALPVVSKELAALLADNISKVTVIRDVVGMITIVIPDELLAPDGWDALSERLDKELAPFSPGPRFVLLRESDLIDRDDTINSSVRFQLATGIWLVDRLITNQDWLQKPSVTKSILPVGVVFSLKGGVGRSTAAAVWSWHLARLGKRTVVIDLDLEAPGLASLLLTDLPDRGLVDWMVDNLIAPTSPELLDDILCPSPVADDAPGTIQVIPAFGANTKEYVAKLGRAYLPTVIDGVVSGLSHRLNTLVGQLSRRAEPPDAILIDARAGLHDLGAAAVTQMGAEVFMFARDDEQTWAGYARLFEHLRQSRGVQYGMAADDLRWRLKMVAAQIVPNQTALEHCLGRSFETWAEFYDDESDHDDDETDVFSRDDREAPHYPLQISFDGAIQGLALCDPAKRPEWRVIEGAMGDFLKSATERLLPAKVDPQ